MNQAAVELTRHSWAVLHLLSADLASTACTDLAVLRDPFTLIISNFGPLKRYAELDCEIYYVLAGAGPLRSLFPLLRRGLVIAISSTYRRDLVECRLVSSAVEGAGLFRRRVPFAVADELLLDVARYSPRYLRLVLLRAANEAELHWVLLFERDFAQSRATGFLFGGEIKLDTSGLLRCGQAL